MNWIDWGIIIFVVYHISEGLTRGMVHLGGSLGAFFGSLLLAIRFHAPVGQFLREKFGLSPMWTNVLGYIAVAFIAEIILAELFSLALSRVPKRFVASKGNRWLGGVLSAGNGILIATFILLVLMALPLRGSIRQDISDSYVGSRLIAAAEKFAAPITNSVNDAAKNALRFITVQPNSGERIALDVAPETSQLAVDEASETAMIDLVNKEREAQGLRPLMFDARLREVARAHSRDMFERRYFSHFDPEGNDAGDRLDRAGIDFLYAGENLAYAPDVSSAHDGLMKSDGHRANILQENFGRIGIGVITAGPDGRMFTQVFTD